MDQLQTVDLVLSITLKVVLLLILLVTLVLFYKVNKTLKFIKDKSTQISKDIKETTNHIKNEITVEKFFEHFKDSIESTINVYLINNARKSIYSLLSKFI